jgi:hypothetical protein
MIDKKNLQVSYSLKEPISKHIAFVDGISRSGKQLTCRVISFLNGGDHYIYDLNIEHMCHLYFVGGIRAELAAAFIQMSTNATIYDRIIGRNLNLRQDDASCILKAAQPKNMLQRVTSDAGIEALDCFNNENRMPVFHLHNAMPSIDMLIKAYPNLKMVHVSRHPIDLAYSWVKRKWGTRELSDPLSFIPIINSKNGPVPWFAFGWAEEFLEGSNAERALMSVLLLADEDEKGYQKLSPIQQSNHIFCFPLEQLFFEPKTVVANIETFFDREADKNMDQMLVTERCPRSHVRGVRQQRFDELKQSLSPRSIERLDAAALAYENRWGLVSFKDP